MIIIFGSNTLFIDVDNKEMELGAFERFSYLSLCEMWLGNLAQKIREVRKLKEIMQKILSTNFN